MLNPHATELTPFPAATKWIVLVHITRRNAPYVYPRLDSILEKKENSLFRNLI